MERIFLIDGHAQIFRMYYAFMRHPLINSKGDDTSILFGFTKMILELINKEHPTHLAVTFDAPGKTFRHTTYKEYKANRPPAPELVIQALEPLKEILKALNIPVIMVTGVEADDVIGSMSAQWSAPDRKIYMVTPDKDYGQLVRNNVFQYKLPKGGNGDTEIIGPEQICSHYGIKEPAGVVDVLTICGDSSDNVPGIKGIGEVGAKKLLTKYGTLDSVIEHISELPEKQQEKIKDSQSYLGMSKFLVTIKTDVELPLKEEEIKIASPDMQAVNEVFGKYEFNSLKKMIAPAGNSNTADTVSAEKDAAYKDAAGKGSADDSIADMPADEDFPEGDFPSEDTDKPQNQIEAQQVEDKPFEMPSVEFCSMDKVAMFAKRGKEAALLLYGESALFIAAQEVAAGTTANGKEAPQKTKSFVHIVNPLDTVSQTADYPPLIEVLTDPKISKCGFGLKEAVKTLAKKAEIKLYGDLYDIQIMHYLIDPEISHSPEFIIRQQLKIELESLGGKGAEHPEPKDLFTPEKDDVEENKEQLAAECSLILPLKKRVEEKLSGGKKEAEDDLYKKIEMPLVSVLADMEMTGVKIDTQQLKEYSKELTVQMNSIEQEAKKLAGDENINLSSPKQIGILLFEKLQVKPGVKKSAKGNYSTDEQTLRELEGTHPIIPKILEYRNYKKLLSTYIDALPQLIDREDGKVHTSFNQFLTATGRLSSSSPNLQNIPIRTERGKEIRKAFIPSDPEGCIVSADYSQIELRLMAHFSGDEELIHSFNSGTDVHAATAAKLFKVPVNEVTDTERRKAKTVNFGIIYGISAFGLAERMEIGVKEAKEFIDAYFKTYPGVSRYISETIEAAHKNGLVETLYGRKRYLRDINSRNTNVRKFNERNAVNAPLQGSAADIIKIAMANVFKRLENEHLKSKMVLQVHDELVFDVLPGEKDAVMKIAKEEMENVAKLKVPLIVDCNYGKNWLEAH